MMNKYWNGVDCIRGRVRRGRRRRKRGEMEVEWRCGNRKMGVGIETGHKGDVYDWPNIQRRDIEWVRIRCG